MNWQCSNVEKNLRIHLIPMRHFYGVQFLNKTGEILQTTLRSYLKAVHRKNVSLVSSESLSFSLTYCTFSSNMLHSRSLPLKKHFISIFFALWEKERSTMEAQWQYLIICTISRMVIYTQSGVKWSFGQEMNNWKKIWKNIVIYRSLN